MNFWKIEKCPFTYCMFHFSFSHCNSPSLTGYGKWFILYILHSLVLIFDPKGGGGGGGVGGGGRVVKKIVISFLIVIGCCLNFAWNIFFRKTILSHFMFFLRVLGIIFPRGLGAWGLTSDIDRSPRVERGGCVSFWTCWREISGDRVALLTIVIIFFEFWRSN